MVLTGAINYLNVRARVIVIAPVATIQEAEISPEEDMEDLTGISMLVPDIPLAIHVTFSVCELIVWYLKVDQLEDSNASPLVIAL